MRETINKLFVWKNNPASVFYIAIPLAVIAVGLLFMQAYLQYKINHNIGYFVIFSIFTVLSAIAGIQMRRMWKKVRPISRN